MSNKIHLGKTNKGLNEGALLNRMTNRIRQSLELQEILSATVKEVRSFLGTDRVKIYRFQPDGNGQVIAEAIHKSRLPSLLNLFFPAQDIPLSSRELFIKARQRVIVDIPSQQTTLSRLENSTKASDLTSDELNNLPIESILQRPVDPCHVQYLKTMGVQSSIVIPILHHQELWGLLVSHHAEPKRFSNKKLQIVQLVADQVSIAISQSFLLSQARERAHREAVINQISKLLLSPLPGYEILQVVLGQIIKALEGTGGRLYLRPNDSNSSQQLYTVGQQPELAETHELLENSRFWQRLAEPEEDLHPDSEKIFDDWNLLSRIDAEREAMAQRSYIGFYPAMVTNIYQETLLEDVIPAFQATRIRSLLVMPLRYGRILLGYLTIFRDEIDTDIIWAGRFDRDDRHQRVRESFAAWRELKHGQAREWLPEEVDLVRSMGAYLTMAIMQSRLYECEREQRVLVEMRNQELNTARTTAEEASRLKSDFLSSTSHELRTPLASTLNYLKLLKEGFYDNPEELQEYIDVAHRSAENLVAIINDVLDIAKIEAGRMQVHWESVNLKAMLQEEENLFRPESRQKEIPLIIDCQVDQVWADALKLRQILTNLLANAFKFTEAGEIRVQTKLRTQETSLSPPFLVEISVTDTGIGIDSKQGDVLFEPFVQADGSIKRHYGGTGLGLTVCKHLVELMGGQIWLRSPGTGQGTTVTFTIPAPVEQPSA
jgi:light-regulated signal transduction histidine kinase (bacteriophytochrome)